MDSFIEKFHTPRRSSHGSQAAPTDHGSSLRAGMMAGLLAVILAGCTVGPNYLRPEMAVPQTYKAQPALNTRENGAAPSLDSWWTGFRDPQLVRIIEGVLAQNLDMAAAMARIQQARAAALAAGAIRMPQGSADASGAWEHQSLMSPLGKIANTFPGYNRNHTLESINAGASWELDLAGGLKRNEEAARDEVQAAEAAGVGVRISVVAEAADAYFGIRGAKARIDLIEAELDADTRLLGLEHRRMMYGVATKRDLAEADARLAQDRAALAPLRTVLELHLNRLNVLMGVTPGTYDDELLKSRPSFVIPAFNPADGPKELLRRRPDVIAAERRLAAANARIGVAMSEYYPKVSLAALLGFESLNARAMFYSSTFQPAAVAGLRWRLFDFGRVDAEVAQAKGTRLEALENYRQAMLRATEDVEDAIAAFAQTNLQKNELAKAVKAFELARTAAQEEYDAGTGDMGGVLMEEHQLLALREMLAHVETEEARGAVAVFRALGGGWTPEALP